MSIRASRNVLDASVSTDPSCLIIGSIFMAPDSLVTYIGTGVGVKQLLASLTPMSVVLSSATPATTRVIDAEPSLTAASVSTTGSIVGVRGNLTIASGTTVTAGYLYGVQGKITIVGTLTSANYSAGLVGQLDLSAATAVSGNLQMLWLDAGAASAVALTSVSALTITNSIASKPLHAIINVPLADAVYFADLNDTADSHWIVGTTASTAAGTIKVLVNGAVRYIQLYSGVA